MAKQSRDTKESERLLLAALCANLLPLDERNEILRVLANYDWVGQDHHAIYEALRRSRPRHSAALREHIIAEVTRLGFPDIDVAPFFAPPALSKSEIEKLAGALLEADSEAPNTK
jgi:hypothetical protein